MPAFESAVAIKNSLISIYGYHLSVNLSNIYTQSYTDVNGSLNSKVLQPNPCNHHAWLQAITTLEKLNISFNMLSNGGANFSQ